MTYFHRELSQQMRSSQKWHFINWNTFFAILAGVLFPLIARADSYPELAPFLKEHEYARGVTVRGPFAAIDIHYRKGGNYFTLSEQFYWRVIYRAKTYIDKVDRVTVWDGPEPATLLIDNYAGDKSRLSVLYELNGKPVLERIDAAALDWDGEQGFEYGYPIDSQTRYFPRILGKDAGFLLSAHPVKIRTLPHGLSGCCVPFVNILAGLAPDGKAFAYTDDRSLPSVVMVVDEQGAHRPPIPIPTSGLKDFASPNEKGPFQPLWRWLNAQFKWEKDRQGRWDLIAHFANPASEVRHYIIEDLFVDALIGYQKCFAPEHPACNRGWRQATDSDERRVFGKEVHISKFAYVPKDPLKAFGVPIEMLYLSKTYEKSGYQLYLKGDAKNIEAAVQNYLLAKKIKHIRVDKCSRDTFGESDCLPVLKKMFQWPANTKYALASALTRYEKERAVFITGHAAFVIRPMENGVTVIQTLARYNFPKEIEKSE